MGDGISDVGELHMSPVKGLIHACILHVLFKLVGALSKTQSVDKKLHRGLPLRPPLPFEVILLRNTLGVRLAW